MSNLISGNQKHLGLNDRMFIEKSLNEGRSFKDISRLWYQMYLLPDLQSDLQRFCKRALQ